MTVRQGSKAMKELMPMPAVDDIRAFFVELRDREAPLGERLAAYADASRKVFPDYATAVDELARRLNEGGSWQGAPRVGDVMPDFMLPDEGGRLVGLADLRSHGPVAVMFHRGHWCPYCRINAHAVARSGDAIAAVGGRVVIVMPERQAYAEKLQADSGAAFPILTDMDNGYALSLNLAIWLGPDIARLLTGYGNDLPRYHGNDAWMVPIPATFVVARDGRVVARFIDPDFRKRMELDDLLTAFRNAS
jgi:peroxiredoxin